MKGILTSWPQHGPQGLEDFAPCGLDLLELLVSQRHLCFFAVIRLSTTIVLARHPAWYSWRKETSRVIGLSDIIVLTGNPAWCPRTETSHVIRLLAVMVLAGNPARCSWRTETFCVIGLSAIMVLAEHPAQCPWSTETSHVIGLSGHDGARQAHCLMLMKDRNLPHD